jgi:hypothetical protein
MAMERPKNDFGSVNWARQKQLRLERVTFQRFVLTIAIDESKELSDFE